MIQPPSFQWQREQGPDIKVKDWIETNSAAKAWDATILGVPFARASISASGAAEFPDAFRRSWSWFSTYYIDEQIDFREFAVLDVGDVQLHATDVTISHERIEQAMGQLIQQYPNAIQTTIGGDHSITAPLVRAIKKASPEKTIGIIQLDTHLDLRDFSAGRTNGTPIRQLVEEGIVKGEHIYTIGPHGFYNAPSLLEAAMKHHIHIIPLKKLRQIGIANMMATIFQQLQVDLIYVTIDIDVLDVAYAPGVPAATPGGMRSDELFELLFEIGKHPIAAIDFVCVDPLRDVAHMTVKATTYAYLTWIASSYQHRK